MILINNFKDTDLVVKSDKFIDLTYDKLKDKLSLLASFIHTRALSFCLCKNDVGSIVGYISFVENGVVPIMLDGNKDKTTVFNLLKIYKPNYIWISSIDYEERMGEVLCEVYDYYLVQHNKEKIILYEDLALLLTTSGSTGSPKLVRLSYENIKSNALSISEYLDISKADRPITSLPLYYSYGLSVINSHLIKGATILVTDKSVIQKEFWEFAKAEKATSISGVPFTYEMMRRLSVMKMDLPYLKTFTQAGGKLNSKYVKEYVREAKDTGKQFIVMYGQTEATARMSYLPFHSALEKYSSIGIEIPNGKFKLVDIDKKNIENANVEGELVYEGPNVSLGYAECINDLSLGDVNSGILYTGDIAYRDSDGYYYITGRMKRFLKIYGNRVNLDALEQLLKTEGIKDIACTGIDDLLTIYTSDITQEDEIKTLILKFTGLNTRAFKVQHIEKIPISSSGKIQYSLLNKI